MSNKHAVAFCGCTLKGALALVLLHLYHREQFREPLRSDENELANVVLELEPQPGAGVAHVLERAIESVIIVGPANNGDLDVFGI